MIKRFILLFAVFVIFVGESIFVDLIPHTFFPTDKIVVPRFLVLVIIAVTAYTTQSFGAFCGILFGFLYDVFYTEVIGIYTFAFPNLAFVTKFALKAFHHNIFVLVFLGLFSIALLEFYTYGLFLIINATTMGFHAFIYNRLFPTLMVNAVIFIMLIYPLKKLILSLQLEHIED
ncbi:rod shape-determining protein MreD [Aeribacillus alveayuensis]|uniref:Rod shape-determining protein MreD n=1 Tax=Aeribacillus alveayuensis TaxID=279215 RepID=A0ABT9VK77_9BACI|nr:rod shape-determining protein MreD [Bacillus alveayuensis]